MIELFLLRDVTRPTRDAIKAVGGSIKSVCKCRQDATECLCTAEDWGYYHVTIPKLIYKRDLFGDGKLDEVPLHGFRWVPLYQLQSGQWLKSEPYDDNRETGEHRRRLVLCDLGLEIRDWITRREELRAVGGTVRSDWLVGLAPRIKGAEHTPGVNPETLR